MTDIEDVLARLSKNVASKFMVASEISRDFLPFASYGLNRVTGGLGRGKQVTIYGNQSAGKSAQMMQTIAKNQRLGQTCAWFDAEHSFDPKWAARLGVDTDKLIVSPISTIPDFADAGVELVRSGIDLMVLDSSSALLPKAAFKDGELKDFGDRNQAGSVARDLGDAVGTINAYNFNTAFAIISQVRMDLSGFKPTMGFTGGKQNEHVDQLRILLTSSMSTKQALHDEVAYGEKVFDEVVGRRVKWEIKKNKVNGREGENGEYDLYTKGDNVGIDYNGEVLDYAQKFGIVTGTNWLEIEGEKFQGRKKALVHLTEHPEVVEALVKRLEEVE